MIADCITYCCVSFVLMWRQWQWLRSATSSWDLLTSVERCTVNIGENYKQHLFTIVCIYFKMSAKYLFIFFNIRITHQWYSANLSSSPSSSSSPSLCVTVLPFITCLLSNLHQVLSSLNSLICFSHFFIYWGKMAAISLPSFMRTTRRRKTT